MVNFENNSIRIPYRLESKHNFNVSYINISKQLYELISDNYSYPLDAIESISNTEINKEKKKQSSNHTDPPIKTNTNKSIILINKVGKKLNYIKLAQDNNVIGKADEEFVLNTKKGETCF